eukprot:COSAG01_NODE_52757_length_344_cov_1.048980_1_plen_40_part_01
MWQNVSLSVYMPLSVISHACIHMHAFCMLKEFAQVSKLIP